MAKVSVEQDVPQIGVPVGSKAEVEALGVPTRNIATCSARTHDNHGCPMWEFCDREFQGTRPQNQIVRRTNTAGVRTYAAPCYDIVPREYTANDNGELYEIVGGEGETYQYRGSRKRHEKRDPDCNDCAAGKCNVFDDVEDLEATCPEFPPAAVHPELKKFARKIVARQQTSVRQKAAIRNSLLGGDDVDEKDEKSDKPRFGRGSRSS